MDRTVYYVGAKHYFSLFGACRHRARMKIMYRLKQYFETEGALDRERAKDMQDTGYRTHEEYERLVAPSKARYKKMRERLTRTIYRRMKQQPPKATATKEDS